MTKGYYSNYDEIDSHSTDNSWTNRSHATMGYADQVRRFIDSDERESMPQHPQGYDTGGYVLAAERVVEHITRAPVVSIMMTNYRPNGNSVPEKSEKFTRDYGAERRYTLPGAIYDPPVENFRDPPTEVSHPITKVPAPFRSDWRAREISSTGQDADNRNGKIRYDTDDDDWGSNQKESYSVIHPGAKAYPVTTAQQSNFYERPNQGPVMANRKPVSRPVNDINDGVEILTEGIRKRPGAIHDPPVENFRDPPTEVSHPITKVPGPFRSDWRARAISSTVQDADNRNGKIRYDTDDDDWGSNQKGSYSVIHPGAKANPVTATNQFNVYERPNQDPVMANRKQVSRPVNDINDGVEILTEGIRNIQSDVNRPSGAGNFGLGRWRNNRTMDADSRDPYSVKEQKTYGMNNKDYENEEGNKPASKLFGKPNSFPSVPQQQQQPRFIVPPNQPAKVNYHSESIDSSEAKKKYGKLKPQAVPIDPKAGTISSDELIKKYNGAKVPW